MLLKILLIALIVYVIVVTRVRVRLPHPGLQATVNVLQAATLRDEHVVATARRFVEYADAQQPAQFPRLPDAAGQRVRDGRR